MEATANCRRSMIPGSSHPDDCCTSEPAGIPIHKNRPKRSVAPLDLSDSSGPLDSTGHSMPRHGASAYYYWECLFKYMAAAQQLRKHTQISITEQRIRAHSDPPAGNTLWPHVVRHDLPRLDHVLKFLEELLVPACFAHVL